MFKSLIAALSPAGGSAHLSTLIFHRVLPQPDPLFPGEVDAARFDRICSWVKDWFNVLPLDEAAQRLQAGTLPSRALAITFDDGYADNHEVALPILRRHALPATFFVATGFLDGGRMWNDTVVEAVRNTRLDALDLRDLGDGRLGVYSLDKLADRQAAIRSILSTAKYGAGLSRLNLTEQIAQRAQVTLPTDLMMTSGQVHALHRAGMQIGAHTMSHPILALLDDGEARAEITGSKHCLESILGQPVTLFAYPNGRPDEDYSPRDVALVKEIGFSAAVSTAWGTGAGSTDIHQLPRFTPWDPIRWRFGARLVRNMLSH